MLGGGPISILAVTKAVTFGVLVCGVAHIIQVNRAIPSGPQKGPSHAAPPFIVGMLLLAFRADIFNPNMVPPVLD